MTLLEDIYWKIDRFDLLYIDSATIMSDQGF